MKRSIPGQNALAYVLILFVFTGICFSQGFMYNLDREVNNDPYLPGRLLLWLDAEYETECSISSNGILQIGITDIDIINSTLGATGGEYLFPVRNMKNEYAQKLYEFRNCYIVYFEDKDTDILDACSQYRQVSGVLEASPDYLQFDDITTPNDEYYDDQWHHKSIQSDYVWDFETGDSGIVITNFESVDWKHPDIAPVVWNNPAEDADGDGITIERFWDSELGEYSWRFDPGDINGVDDDSNGYVDDFIGWDFIAFEEDDIPVSIQHSWEDYYDEDNDPNDDVGEIGHGTHVASTIVGASNNEIGTAAVNWQSKVCVIRGGYHYYRDGVELTGTHPTSAQNRSYGYAILMGIRIWNMSFGGYSYDGVTSSLVRTAWDETNAFICAAAGNDAVTDNHYPAAYTHVMGVAALNDRDYRASFSCYGDRVDIAAPGEDIWAAIPRFNAGSERTYPYGEKQGTSMASPIVTGAASLLLSMYPDSSNLFIYLALEDHATPLPDPLYDDGQLGAGKVNPFYSCFKPIFDRFETDSFAFWFDDDVSDGVLDVGETGYFAARYINDDEWLAPGDITMTLTCDHDGITIPTPTITLPTTSSGGSVSNFDNPIEFVPNELLDDGKTVKFTLTLESSTGFFVKDTMSIDIGYPWVMLYDRDGGAGHETWIMNDLQAGNVNYFHWDADVSGTIDTDFALSHFHSIIFIHAENETEPITTDDIAFLESFLDDGDNRNLFIGGQFLADYEPFHDFMENYCKTEHVADELEDRFWGLYTIGVAGDTVTNNLMINTAFGGDCMGMQSSQGQCQALTGAYNTLTFRDHEDVFCATRYEEAGYKTFFTEFSPTAVTGVNPEGHIRFTLVHNVLQWFGTEFTAIKEDVSTPGNISIANSYPNPFNSTVNIEFTNETSGRVTVSVHDITGKMIDMLFDTYPSAGTRTVKWTPKSDIPTGVYMLRVQTPDKTETKRMLYVK